MLTATDDRSSHIKNRKNKKVILLNCCTLTYDDVQRYSNKTFLFLLFLMCELRSSVAVNMCIKFSFLHFEIKSCLRYHMDNESNLISGAMQLTHACTLHILCEADCVELTKRSKFIVASQAEIESSTTSGHR